SHSPPSPTLTPYTTLFRSPKPVKPGSYSTTEDVPAGWDLTKIKCSDSDSSGDLGTATASYNVAAGEDVTCTYTDSRLPTLKVKKHVVNDNGGSAVAGNWSLHVKLGSSEVTGSPKPGS